MGGTDKCGGDDEHGEDGLVWWGQTTMVGLVEVVEMMNMVGIVSTVGMNKYGRDEEGVGGNEQSGDDDRYGDDKHGGDNEGGRDDEGGEARLVWWG